MQGNAQYSDRMRRIPARRWSLAIIPLISALLVPTSAVAAPAPAHDPAQPGGFAGLSVSSLDWTPCGSNGFECATLTVPLDYRDPAAGTIGIAVNRHKAADSARRIGAMVVNPGGPGGSGKGLAQRMLSMAPKEIVDRFDIVGFDPRGVGESSPVSCLTADETTDAFAKVTAGVDDTDRPFAHSVKLAAQFNAKCQERSGKLLPYIGTEYVARDIDMIRAALGEEKLTYFGFSFGTFIGTVYANLFPQRVRAALLDGAYDPEHYANEPYKYDQPQFDVVDRAINLFLDWCADPASKCAFGNGKPHDAFDQLLTDLDANPIVKDGKVVANGTTVAYSLIFAVNGGRRAWPAFAARLVQAQQRTGPYVAPIGGNASFFAPNTAVECADRVYPQDMNGLRNQLAKEVHRAPILGAPAAYGSPGYDHSHATACTLWKAERKSRYAGPWDAKGSAPILVVGTTGDPDTPYQDAVALRRTLANSRLLTFVGEGHTGYSASPCTKAAASEYLLNLTLPADGTRCNDDPGPAS
ncbi:alpha/beta hydrolase [Pseudonocardiaceae bacterium YIM PH 21723]|nr:alpha/beta hydrolase [Pseudonocardiaceae bacterium YIM PH 21723]